MRNIEIKARLHDLPAARRVAEKLATRRVGVQEQIDTYFRCANGRLNADFRRAKFDEDFLTARA